MSDPKHIVCDLHPGPQRWYIVCKHIAQEHKPVYFQDPPTDTIGGEISCLVCYEHDKTTEYAQENYICICEPCAIANIFKYNQ